MTCDEGIVFALLRRGKTADSILLAKRVKRLRASGQHLVHVALMSHVKYDFILRTVEHIMNRDRQFHDSKV